MKWTKEELKQMDQRARKLTTMQRTLHPRDDVDKLYVSRKEEGQGPTSIGDSVDATMRLEDYNIKCGGRTIRDTRNNTDNARINRAKITKLEEKQL